MVPLEAWLFVGSLLSFGSALWLVALHGNGGIRAFERLADARGWDCRREVPTGLTARLAEIVHVGPPGPGRLFLAGPTRVGPFQLVRAAQDAHEVPRAERAWTFLHLRTANASRGLWVMPSQRFRVERGGDLRDESAFVRRFQVGCLDDEDHERVDEEVRALLLRPDVPVRIGWVDQDLVIAFPLAVSSPRGVDRLLGYGTALAARLTAPRRSALVVEPVADPASDPRRVVL